MSYTPELQTGQRFGNYELVTRIFKSDRVDIWRSRHATLPNIEVAIKIWLNPMPGEMELIQREAAIMSKMRNCPNVLNVEDFGSQNGINYMVTQLADAGDLSLRVHSDLSLKEIHTYISQIAVGLDYGHALGIIHRNLKPANILLDNKGMAIIADYKLALDPDMPLAISSAGTPEYEAPEQFNGFNSVGPAADLYSLGVIVYQMLVKQLPYGARSQNWSAKNLEQAHQTAPIPTLSKIRPDLPAYMQEVINQALAKDPKDRFANAGMFADAFKIAMSQFSKDTDSKIRIMIPRDNLGNAAQVPAPISRPNTIHEPTPVEVAAKVPVPDLPPGTPVLPQIRNSVFISYNKADKRWLERLQVHLTPLERDMAMEVWDDTKIKPGDRWAEAMQQALASAKVAVLLVSADFLATETIAEKELPTLLAAAEKGGTRILPLILSPSRFQNTQLGQFQAVNPPDDPLCDMPKGRREALFVKLTQDIEEALKA